MEVTDFAKPQLEKKKKTVLQESLKLGTAVAAVLHSPAAF